MIPSARFRALAATLVLFASTSFAATAAPASPQQVFDRYVASVNAGDMATIGTLISERVERSDYPGCTPAMNNKACLLTYVHDTVVGADGRIKMLQSEVQADTVHARLEVASKTARGFGLERIVGTDVVQVRDGMITAFRFVPEFADDQTATFFGRLGIGPRAALKASAPAKP